MTDCGKRRSRSWRGQKVSLLQTLSAVLAMTLVLTGCGDNAAVEEVKRKVEARDTEIKKLNEDLIERSKRIGFLEGQIEAKLGNFDRTLEDGLAACREKRNDSALSEQLARIEQSCTKLRENVKVAVDCLADPRPVGCPSPQPIREEKRPPKEDNINGEDGIKSPRPDCIQFPKLPGCRPVRPDDPPPNGSNVKGDEGMKRTVLLAAAYLACTYYTAGTCAIILSSVAAQLGMSESDVRKNMESSFKDLGEAANRGVEIPGPDGKPVVLNLRTAPELIEAKKKYDALPQADRDDPCMVIEVFRTVGTMNRYLASLLDPLQFSSQQQKNGAIVVAREVDLKLAEVLGKVPVKPKAFRCAT